MLLCSNGLPASGNEFKLFLMQFYKQPVHLKNFTLDIGPTPTTVKCRIAYGTNVMISHSLFYFSNGIFRNMELLRKQLKNLSFTYKITKSQLFFQVMQCDVGTGINFYYNATLDKYASPPSGMTYSQFLNRNKSKIVFYNNYPASASPASGSQFPAEVQQPTSGQQVQQLDQAAAQLTAAPGPSHTFPPPPAASTTAEGNVAIDAFDTPRRLRYGPPPSTIGRSLFPHLDYPENSGSPFSVTAAHLESLKYRALSSRSQHNQRIIRELTQTFNLQVDTTQLTDLFSQTTWNIKKVGLMNLALFGILTVTDNRSEESGETTDNTISDLVDEFGEQDYESGKDREKEKQ